MSFIQSIIKYLKGEVTELAAEVTAFEKKLLPGADAIAKKALKVFGEKALPILEQLAEALISGLASGGNVGVLIPQLVNDAIKDLAPEAIADGKNVLYAVANLALAEATETVNETGEAPVEQAHQESGVQVETPAIDTSASESSATDGQAVS